MAGTNKYQVDAWSTMMTTELNALAATTGVLQATGTNAAYDNSTNLRLWGDFELQCTYAVAPTAGKTVDLYLIPLSSTAGTTYADGSATIQQASLYIGSWVLRNISTLHILYMRGIPLPPAKFILSVLNNGDQALTASGHTVKFLPYGMQYT
jgi:hypothetical protein